MSPALFAGLTPLDNEHQQGKARPTCWCSVRGRDLIGGWALDANGVRIGLTRVLFPFIAGVLLVRLREADPGRERFRHLQFAAYRGPSPSRFGGLNDPG